MNKYTDDTRVTINAPVSEAFKRILTPEAIAFVTTLADEFEEQRQTILKNRKQVQANIDNGIFPDFPEETRQIRESNWRVAPHTG